MLLKCRSEAMIVNRTKSVRRLTNLPGAGRAGWARAFCALALSMGLGNANAQTSIVVPNASFESPSAPLEIPYATEQLDVWEKTPEPADYDPEAGQGPWVQKSGVFLNIPTPQVIDNMDGAQGAFLFSFPEAGFFQDYLSVGGTNTMPTFDFDATYEVGKTYRLTAGFTTSTFQPVQAGATLRMGLYYRDAASNRVIVAETTVMYSTNDFPDPFHLVDFSATVPGVDAGDAWAGEHIGIEFVSTVSTNLQGGVWDLDNVRLIEFESPTLTQPLRQGDEFQFSLLSDAGAVLEVLTSTDVALAVPGWTSLGMITNASGLTNFAHIGGGATARFYTARQLP